MCTAVPVCEGKVHNPPKEAYLRSAVARFDYGGRDVTDFLQKLSCERGYSYTTSKERELVRHFKESYAYVALDYEAEMKVPLKVIEKSYEMLDNIGNLTFANERFRCTEFLFRPALIGKECQDLQDVIHYSIMRCNADVREKLFSNILLCGGNSLLPGFGARLKKELQRHDSGKVEVFEPPNRHHLSWVGASSFAGGTPNWISKDEYDEVGPSIVLKKCV